jgi:hypothetical protein
MVAVGELQKFAEQARRDFEAGSIARPLLRKLYSAYNPQIGELDVFLDGASNLFPQGNCGLASVYLKEITGEGEVVQGKYGSEPHTFLVINGQVIDITADQFDGPAVYVGNLAEPWNVG